MLKGNKMFIHRIKPFVILCMVMITTAAMAEERFVDSVGRVNVALAQEDIKAIMEGLDKAFAVSPAGTLAVSWGNVKIQ